MITTSFAIIGIATLTVVHGTAFADGGSDKGQGWKYSLGAGLLIKPRYLGDDDYVTQMLPSIGVTYSNTFFASVRGIGYNVVNSDNWRAGPIAKFDFGRRENGRATFGVTGSDSTDLMGLGDVDATVEVGGFVEYSKGGFKVKTEVVKAVSSHKGVTGEIEVKYGGAFQFASKRAFYSFGPKIKFVDRKYNTAYFGVDAQQSAASGLAQYDAGSGLVTVGLHASLVYPLSKRLSLIGLVGYDQLQGDAAKSSLVQTRGSENQTSGGLIVSYSF